MSLARLERIEILHHFCCLHHHLLSQFSLEKAASGIFSSSRNPYFYFKKWYDIHDICRFLPWWCVINWFLYTGFTGADQNVQDLSGSPAVNGFEVSWVVPDKHCDVYGYRILSVNAEEGGEEHKGKTLWKTEKKITDVIQGGPKKWNGILPTIFYTCVFLM